MRGRRSPMVDQRNAPVLERIQALKAERSFWGYRRIWVHLHFAEGLAVNKKRILLLMRVNGHPIFTPFGHRKITPFWFHVCSVPGSRIKPALTFSLSR